MKIRGFILYIIILVCTIINVGRDFEDYEKLENKQVVVVKREDLPSEFSDNAYRTIVDFIQKTRNLNYE